MRFGARAAVALVALAACGGAPAAAPPELHGHGPLVHRFEHADAWTKEFDDPARDAWQRPGDVVAAMGLHAGARVADVGAGTGYFEPHLARAVGPGGAVIAVDVEPDMVRYLRERALREHLENVRAELATFDDPKLPAGSVDRILVVDTWHHIDHREAYAAKLRDALAPGGAVFVVDFTEGATHGPPKHHRLPPEAVVRELGAGGLSARVLPVGLPEQYVVVGER